MKDWQERVIDEQTELKSKLAKLEHFLATAALDPREAMLLAEQKDIMFSYILVLQQRIDNWS